MTTGGPTPEPCPYCSNPPHSLVYHYGGPCPKVKAIEYYPNGIIKKVEFKDEHAHLDPANRARG